MGDSTLDFNPLVSMKRHFLKSIEMLGTQVQMYKKTCHSDGQAAFQSRGHFSGHKLSCWGILCTEEKD